MLKRARYERWLTVALLELALLRQRFDCARARAAAFARLRARAQSDTGVGKVLNLDLVTTISRTARRELFTLQCTTNGPPHNLFGSFISFFDLLVLFGLFCSCMVNGNVCLQRWQGVSNLLNASML